MAAAVDEVLRYGDIYRGTTFLHNVSVSVGPCACQLSVHVNVSVAPATAHAAVNAQLERKAFELVLSAAWGSWASVLNP